jgi:hypothetical protein
MQIKIKEPIRRRAVEYTEEVYTPERIRELWGGDSEDTCLVLALLKKWEDAAAEVAHYRAEYESMREESIRLTELCWSDAKELAAHDAEVASLKVALREALDGWVWSTWSQEDRARIAELRTKFAGGL